MNIKFITFLIIFLTVLFTYISLIVWVTEPHSNKIEFNKIQECIDKCEVNDHLMFMTIKDKTLTCNCYNGASFLLPDAIK